MISIFKRIIYKINLHFAINPIISNGFFHYINCKYKKQLDPLYFLQWYRLIWSTINKINSLRWAFKGNENKNINNFAVYFLCTIQLSKVRPTDLLIRRKTLLMTELPWYCLLFNIWILDMKKLCVRLFMYQDFWRKQTNPKLVILNCRKHFTSGTGQYLAFLYLLRLPRKIGTKCTWSYNIFPLRITNAYFFK